MIFVGNLAFLMGAAIELGCTIQIMSIRHLYLHVPFCLRRCSYCDFAVQPTRRPATDEWLLAITTELDLLQLPLQLQTIYLGGGTPSLLGTGAMARLRAALAERADLSQLIEWTAEANPENLTAELAEDWRAAGINRVSIGIQTFHQPALKWMGRLHGPDGGVEAVRLARAAGMTNVSVDLIFALPDHLGRNWRADLERAIALEPEHVSLYGLTAESGAALGRWVREGRAQLPADERYADEYLLAAELLGAAGYRHYEVSNFARPGFESRHNSAYWTGAAYLGIGPSAHSLLPPERTWNLRSWSEYQAALAQGQLPREDSETIAGDTDALERIWLGLRTDSGVHLPELTGTQQDLLQRWQEAGWARIAHQSARLTPQGWLLLDQLAVELAK